MAQRPFFEVMESFADLVKGDALLDDALTQPFDFEPEILYVWEEERVHRSIGTGEVREDFVIMAVRATENEGETAVAERSRDVTRRLSAWADTALDAIRLRGAFAMGDDGDVTAGTDADFLRQLQVRGSAIRITGYRLID